MLDAYTRYEQQHGPLVPPSGLSKLESRALSTVQQHASEAEKVESFSDFKIEEIRLAGQFPRTCVEVLFRWSRYPGLLFGRRRGIWNPDGSYATYEIKDLLLFLKLDQENRRRELDPPTPDVAGVRWI